MNQQTKFKDTEIGRIPEDWQVKSVQELVNLNIIEKPMDGNHGGIHPKNSDFVDNGIPFIMASDLKNGHVDTSNCKYIKKEQADKLQKGFAKNGDVLLTHKATMGRTAIIDNIKTDYIMLTPQVTFYRIKDSDELNNYFLKYYFDSQGFQSLFNSWAGSGSTRAYLGITGQRKLPIIIPLIGEQSIIAHIFASLDDKITLNHQMNVTLKAIGQALFKNWFVDFEFPNEDGKPYKSSGGEMVKSELGEVPVGWRVGVFKDCCKRIENGGTPKRSEPKYWELGTIPWLTSGEVRQSIVISTDNLISNEGLANSSAKLWPSGTTVVALYGATAGQVCFQAEEMCANQACCGLIPSKKMRFYIYLRASLSIEAFERQTRGSAQQNLSQQIVADFPTTIPDYGVLERFDKAVEPIFDKWISNLNESRALAKIRDTLLPKLMSGEIRVNTIDNKIGAKQ